MDSPGSIVVSWQIRSLKPLLVDYFLDGRSAGCNDAGFDQILLWLRNEQHFGAILFSGRASSSDLGGAPIQASLPFYTRWDEVLKLLGDRQIRIEIL
jgi:hypothetical protein